MFCSQCGGPIPATADHCPRCGADLRSSGAVRLTPPMTRAEIVRELPEELVETAIRPPLPLDHEASTPPPPPADHRVGSATAAAPSTPTDATHELPIDPRLFDERAQQVRADAAQRHVRAASSRQHTRRNRIALVVLAMALLVAVVPIVIVSWSLFNLGPSADPSPSASVTTSPTVPSAAPSSTTKASSAPSISTSRKPTPTPRPTPTRLPWPASATPCGADVAVNRQTSCAFARTVLAQVDRTRTGPFTVVATSPVTKQTYTLSCTRPDFIVCTGGRSVRILLQPL
ncbi:zinc ribbon domain-containing protein [Aestuariimicrobium kwangyangense]|uniref:zinc ribbon domain-containing protein n=1 Tax=Aestuariimicrobium kwangyangense TaxID=396389 RepID=UPI0003B69BED|nr:zinc ribbon domain-containing protein [Aestuariimicrobium kwangyangense]